MMDAFRIWLIGLMTVALILTVLSAVLPEGSVKKIAGVTGGLVLLLVILRGVGQLDLGQLQLSYDDCSRQHRSLPGEKPPGHGSAHTGAVQCIYIGTGADVRPCVQSPGGNGADGRKCFHPGLCHHGYILSRRIVSNRGGKLRNRCTAPEMVDIGRVK